MSMTANPYELNEFGNNDFNIVIKCDECNERGEAEIQSSKTKRSYGFVDCKKCGGKGYVLTELGKQVYAIVLNPGGWKVES